MSGSSEKKIKKSKETNIIFFQLVLLLVTIFYLIAKILSGVFFETWQLAYMAFFSGVSYFTYNQIRKGLEYGLEADSYSTSIDIFVLNSFVQFTTCFNSNFWYLYLLIPGILVWKLLQYLWGSAMNIQYKEDDGQKGGKSKKKKEDKVYKNIK